MSKSKEPSYQQIADQITGVIRIIEKNYKLGPDFGGGLYYAASDIRDLLLKALKETAVREELRKRGFN